MGDVAVMKEGAEPGARRDPAVLAVASLPRAEGERRGVTGVGTDGFMGLLWGVARGTDHRRCLVLGGEIKTPGGTMSTWTSCETREISISRVTGKWSAGGGPRGTRGWRSPWYRCASSPGEGAASRNVPRVKLLSPARTQRK